MKEETFEKSVTEDTNKKGSNYINIVNIEKGKEPLLHRLSNWRSETDLFQEMQHLDEVKILWKSNFSLSNSFFSV